MSRTALFQILLLLYGCSFSQTAVTKCFVSGSSVICPNPNTISCVISAVYGADDTPEKITEGGCSQEKAEEECKWDEEKHEVRCTCDEDDCNKVSSKWKKRLGEAHAEGHAKQSLTSNPAFLATLCVSAVVMVGGIAGLLTWQRAKKRKASARYPVDKTQASDSTRKAVVTPGDTTGRTSVSKSVVSSRAHIVIDLPSKDPSVAETVLVVPKYDVPDMEHTTPNLSTKRQKASSRRSRKAASPPGPFASSTPEQIINMFFNSTAQGFHASNFHNDFQEIRPIKCRYRDIHEIPDEFLNNKEYTCRTQTLWRSKKRSKPGFLYNANVVGKRRNIVIAQSPLSHTMTDFYHGIMESRARAIIMLANRNELYGELYYPKREQASTGQTTLKHEEHGLLLMVEAKKEVTIGAIEKCTLEVQLKNEYDSPYELVHYYVPNWFELTRFDTDNLDDLVSALDEAIKIATSGPIVVHCFDGTGPSGCVALAIDIVQRVLAGHVNVQPLALGKEIREARDGAIETPLEFAFAVLLAMKILAARVPPSESISNIVYRYEDELRAIQKKPSRKARLARSKDPSVTGKTTSREYDSKTGRTTRTTNNTEKTKSVRPDVKE